MRPPRETATRLLPATQANIAEAARLLRAGALVAFGTETVYGLGADATNDHAVAAIFAAKGRPHFNPLICHYPEPDAVFAHVQPNPRARALAAAFWPGPLTLVLPRRDLVPDMVTSGLSTVAVRMSAHPVFRAVASAFGKPLAAPSANPFGRISPTTAAHVLDSLAGRIAAILDSGPCIVGVESTVLDLSGSTPVLLRPGGLPREAIEAVIGPVGIGITPAESKAGQAEAARGLRSPGLLVSHYAPRLPVRLSATSVAPTEALLAFGPKLPGAAITYQLSESADTTEAAARLFAGLRSLDAAAQTLSGIAVMPIPDTGLGAAINDRLQRAAAPRC